MDPSSVTSIISTLGFPIAACVALFIGCKYMLDNQQKNTDRMFEMYDADGNLVGADVCAHLRQQLCTVTWERDKQNRLKLIDKEELRKLIGMSPDIGDAAALTCLERYADNDPEIVQKQALDRSKLRKYRGMMG